jgi:hypothetical protein
LRIDVFSLTLNSFIYPTKQKKPFLLKEQA